MKKYILGAAFSLALLASPAFTQAAGLTSSQIQAILSLLSSFGADSATIANVNVALTGGTPTTTGRSFCHNFSSDLTVGNGGDDVSALNQALTLSGIDTTGNAASFTENTAGDVVSFQAKYSIRQTGYVGPITRGKLNALYRCGSNQQPVQPAPVQPTNPTVSTPVITGLSTPASAITPGTKIVVSGYNFDSNSLIELDGNQALGITPVSYSPTSLVFVLPTSWGVGTHSVRVVQMKVSNVMSNSVTFTVTSGAGATSGLTSAQIQAILSLLSSFDANSTTVANITTVLNGGTLTTTLPASSGLTSAQIQSVLSLLSSFGASSTTIANVSSVLGTALTATPTITVLSPNGGEVWHPGETRRISWTSSNVVNNVKIYIYDSNVFGSGSTNYITPNGNAIPGLAGYYDWAIPSFGQLPPFNGFGSTNYKIRIDNADTNTVLDSSNAPFSILAAIVPSPTITVLSPNGGESFVAGQGTIHATYQSSNISGQQLTAYLYSPTLGNVRSVSGYASSNGSIDIPLDKGGADPAGQYKIHICANNIDNPTMPGKFLCDSSDNYFALASVPTGLTSAQIQSILSLLSSFGANSTTIANMTTILNGGTLTTTLPASSGLTSSQIQSILGLLSSFGASSTTIANASSVLGSTVSTVSQPTIHLSGSSGNQVSDSSISVGIGGTFIISGMPQNLQGMPYYYYGSGSPPSGYYNRAFFFDQNFSNNNSCGTNDGSSTGVWTMTCTAKVSGSSTFYVEIYANGQTYRSNQVTVTIPNGMG